MSGDTSKAVGSKGIVPGYPDTVLYSTVDHLFLDVRLIEKSRSSRRQRHDVEKEPQKKKTIGPQLLANEHATVVTNLRDQLLEKLGKIWKLDSLKAGNKFLERIWWLQSKRQ